MGLGARDGSVTDSDSLDIRLHFARPIMAPLFRNALHAKAGQAFVVFLLVDYAAPLIIEQFLSAHVAAPRASDPLGLAVWGPAWAVMMLLFLLWYRAVGLFLLERAPERRPSDQALFRFTTTFPVAYSLVAPALFVVKSYEWTVVLLALHLLTLGCILHTFKAIARLLTLFETGEWKPFREYFGTFFLLWFFPIGVWTIQPRINRIYAANRSDIEAEA
jgi:hypothetical protein